MNLWWNSLGLVVAVTSAAALYASSPHCRWRMPRHRSRIGRTAGVLLAAASLGVWIHSFGVAVGASTMLMAWMLTLVALPWLTLFVRGKVIGSARGA